MYTLNIHSFVNYNSIKQEEKKKIEKLKKQKTKEVKFPGDTLLMTGPKSFEISLV